LAPRFTESATPLATPFDPFDDWADFGDWADLPRALAALALALLALVEDRLEPFDFELEDRGFEEPDRRVLDLDFVCGTVIFLSPQQPWRLLPPEKAPLPACWTR